MSWVPHRLLLRSGLSSEVCTTSHLSGLSRVDISISDWNVHRKECSDFANGRTVVDADTTPGGFDAP